MPLRRRRSTPQGGRGPAGTATARAVPRVLSSIHSPTRDLLDLLQGAPEAVSFHSRVRPLFDSGPEFFRTRPAGYRPAGRVVRSDPRYSALRILQSNPRVRHCVQRRRRREVLFAHRVAGRSGGSPGPYRRTYSSQFRC